jgi:hypothetical protein
MAHLAHLRIYPVKGLDGQAVEEATVRDGGTLAGDREFALVDPEGETVNAKQSGRLQALRTEFDRSTGELRVETPAGQRLGFDLDSGTGRAGEWFSEFLDRQVRLEQDRSVGFVDRRGMGPSVISTATLEAVASWFDGVTVEGARRRLRANVEVGGVPAFWEDRFVGEGAPAFSAGGVRFEGVTPCARCIVPARDPDTGQPLEGFREQFLRRRQETFPEWADREAFDHLYTLMIITRIPESDRGGSLEVGDAVERLPTYSRS